MYLASESPHRTTGEGLAREREVVERFEPKAGMVRSTADVAATILLAAMTVLVFVTVILRYFFSITFRWSDELTRYIFIYVVFLGIPIAYRCREHVVIEVLVQFLPARMRRLLEIPVHLGVGLLMLAVGIAGAWLTFGRMGKPLTSGLQIPRAYMHAALPLGVFFLLLEIALKLQQAFRRRSGAP
jgi:TRAP-type C4-dicarboxylate transport system permease small subunit